MKPKRPIGFDFQAYQNTGVFVASQRTKPEPTELIIANLPDLTMYVEDIFDEDDEKVFNMCKEEAEHNLMNAWINWVGYIEGEHRDFSDF